MSESFAELFEQSQIEGKMRPGSIVSATVVDINQDTVVVNAGLKSEGLIPISQFFDEKGDVEVSIGDEVDVSLDAVEDGFGETRLSREKAKRLMAWTSLEKAHEADEIVTGIISERVKGGFTVDIDKVRAFLPGSLIDVRPVKDTSYLEGKPLEFKVIKSTNVETMWLFHVVQLSKQKIQQTALNYLNLYRKVLLLRVLSKTQQIMVHSLIWVVLTDYFISRTWPGKELKSE